MNNPQNGLNNTSAYLMSGLPFVKTITNSSGSISFDYVTKEITIAAIGGPTTIYFQANTTADRKFIVLSNTTVTLDVRVKSLFYETTTTSSIFASLTTISESMMQNLTSSIWTGI